MNLNFTSQAIDPKLDSLLPSCKVYEAAVDRRTPGINSSYDELVQQTRGYIGSAWTGFEPAKEAENYLGIEWTTGREERGKRTDEEKDEINKEHTTWLKDHAEDLQIRIQQRQEKKRMAKESKYYLMEEGKRRKKYRHEKKLINAREKKERLLNVKQSKKIFLKEWSKLAAPRPLGSHYDLSFLAMLYFDGGCRTLSGIAGAGAYLRVVRSTTTVEIPVVTIHRVRWYSDESAGSMDAEYHGLLQGLKMLHSLLKEFWQAIRSDDTDAYSSQLANEAPTVRIQVYGDALNIIENMTDNKAVPNPKLEAIHTSCMDIVRTMQQNDHVEIHFHHIYRQYNEIADGKAFVLNISAFYWSCVS
jgi:ribonuclease HI